MALAICTALQAISCFVCWRRPLSMLDEAQELMRACMNVPPGSNAGIHIKPVKLVEAGVDKATSSLAERSNVSMCCASP